jgi:hypothetical protein
MCQVLYQLGTCGHPYLCRLEYCRNPDSKDDKEGCKLGTDGNVHNMQWHMINKLNHQCDDCELGIPPQNGPIDLKKQAQMPFTLHGKMPSK